MYLCDMRDRDEVQILENCIKKLVNRLEVIDFLLEDIRDIAHSQTIKKVERQRQTLSLHIQQIESLKNFWKDLQ